MYLNFHNAGNPEGPVSLPDGRWVVTEMSHGLISEVSADGQNKRVIAETGRPNGLTLEAAGNLWVAESKYPALLNVTLAGQSTAVTNGPDHMPFLWPNDLCFGPDHALYMTDSGILLGDMETISPPEAVYDHVFDGRVWRIDLLTGECELLDQGLRFANGIAFGPGGDYLYASETLTGNIYRYQIESGHVVGGREFFGNVMIKPCVEFGRLAGPDGMAFDMDGNLHVCVLEQGDITILDKNGTVMERWPLPGTFPTNIAFDSSGRRQALITEGSENQLLLLKTAEVGLPLFTGA